jgi:hypothetical protein
VSVVHDGVLSGSFGGRELLPEFNYPLWRLVESRQLGV